MAKKNTLENVKIARLARQLNVCKGVAFGLLVTIWDFASIQFKDGAMSRLDILDAMQYGGWDQMFTVDQVIMAMTNVEAMEKLLLDPLPDGRYFIHDWHEHAEDSVNRALARAGKRFANGAVPNLSRLPEKERHAAEKAYQQEDPHAPKEEIVEPKKRTKPPKVREECAQSTKGVRTNDAQSAHVVRTECAPALALALALPLPLPEPLPLPGECVVGGGSGGRGDPHPPPGNELGETHWWDPSSLVGNVIVELRRCKHWANWVPPETYARARIQAILDLKPPSDGHVTSAAIAMAANRSKHLVVSTVDPLDDFVTWCNRETMRWSQVALNQEKHGEVKARRSRDRTTVSEMYGSAMRDAGAEVSGVKSES